MKKNFLLLSFILMGCVPDILLTKENVGQVIEAKTKDQIIIKLNENPTTGYQWKFEIFNEKNEIIEKKDAVVQVSYEQTVKDPHIAGAGGIKTFKIKFKNIGKYQIKGKYERSWEQNSAIKEVQYKIFVK
ncbi:MAG: protease inhibitor I42 family protein [Alphaproteobacteria bacterium]|nr:protease inhibitor I42 family protein [Alphaproteobacteria bacterium]